MSIKNIYIKGVKQHNLKNIDITIPRNKFTVITGPSGSGKSSLAFDTLYAEGQRRYVESLSAYARQFLDRMQKPELEHIEGLSPAIAIEQRSGVGSPRSTVSTTTEIYDYMRLLYAHLGVPHCPKCGIELKSQNASTICDKILSFPEGKKLMILAPYIEGKKGNHRGILENIAKDGFVRARIDGEIVRIDEGVVPLERYKIHTIEAVVDRLVTGKIDRARLHDSVETALKHGNGTIVILLRNNGEDGKKREEWIEEKISEKLACVKCGISFPELKPRNFSFNSPYGACERCHGIGSLLIMSPELVVPDPKLSIKKGAIPAWRRGPRRLIIYYNHILKCVAEHFNMPDLLKIPFKDIPDHIKRFLLYGSGDEPVAFDFYMRGRLYQIRKPFEGILANLERRYRETESDSVRERLRSYMVWEKCPECKGARLKKENLAVTFRGLNIYELNRMSVEKLRKFFDNLKLNKEEHSVAKDILREIRSRLKFLEDVGLSYITLDRESSTLSGGEAQRIRLATQLGCGLVGVLYILDEPTIGLHQRDNQMLLNTLKRLRDIGNTIIVVEHDPDTIKNADYIIDLGPGAGRLGGEVVAEGTYKDIIKNTDSLTGKYLSGKLSIPIPKQRKKGNGKFLKIKGVKHHNLKNINVSIPLGTFCCVTGVSGSGKSSLVNDVLKRAIYKKMNIKTPPPGEYKKTEGMEHIHKLIVIDQSPIGRTPRSNPATYTDAFTGIRKLFASLPDAKVRGYTPGRFSFNVKGGRCEECKGDGIRKIEMHFLPDVYVTCGKCGGKRFNEETLKIKYKRKSIADVLDMTVDEACEFFENVPYVYRKLSMLKAVGLGYIHLGQPATTLSGGEAQRVKLAAELAKIPRGHTLYILDEPTTGLHLSDIQCLLNVLMRLRDHGNTVLVIEHNLEVIKTADHIIDLGPEGGDKGGEVVITGTPEQIIKSKKSYTGKYLKPLLKK